MFIQTTNGILRAIDKRKLTDIFPSDMSKAFDRINNLEILPDKKQDSGPSVSVIEWFRSYLTSRYQAVRINTPLSDKLPVTSQASHWGASWACKIVGVDGKFDHITPLLKGSNHQHHYIFDLLFSYLSA